MLNNSLLDIIGYSGIKNCSAWIGCNVGIEFLVHDE